MKASARPTRTNRSTRLPNSGKYGARSTLQRTPLSSPESPSAAEVDVKDPVFDRPHNPESFDLWSNGPNGINEFGHAESDDVTSWSDGR